MRGGKAGSRISPAVESIIQDAIENFHNTEQQQSIAETVYVQDFNPKKG